MLSEINQILEIVRKDGSVASAKWPMTATLTPADVGLVERAGRYIRAQSIEEIDPVTLQKTSQKLGLKLTIEHHPVVGSTNRMLMQRGTLEDIGGLLITCDYQHAGRGRRGRSWVSPYARNLAFSFAHRSQKPLSELGGLSCVVGIATVDALTEAGVSDLKLKWPNDLWVNGKKLAGILVELASKGPNTLVVIGIGINMALTRQERSLIDQPVTDLNSSGVKGGRSDLLMKIMQKLIGYLEHFEKTNFADFISAFNALHVLHQQPVVVHPVVEHGNTEILGRVVGVGVSGQLIVDTKVGPMEFLGGEVSLRPARSAD